MNTTHFQKLFQRLIHMWPVLTKCEVSCTLENWARATKQCPGSISVKFWNLANTAFTNTQEPYKSAGFCQNQNRKLSNYASIEPHIGAKWRIVFPKTQINLTRDDEEWFLKIHQQMIHQMKCIMFPCVISTNFGQLLHETHSCYSKSIEISSKSSNLGFLKT